MKTSTVIRTLFIVYALNFSYTPQAFAKKEKEVFINSDNLFSSGPTKPIEDLSWALRNHKKSSLFRVTWNASASLAQDYSVILYNRKRHTLKYYYWGDWLVAEEPTTIREISSRTVLYTGVKDQMIHNLFEKFKTTNMGADEIFPKLVNYGAKEKLLAQKSHKRTIN